MAHWFLVLSAVVTATIPEPRAQTHVTVPLFQRQEGANADLVAQTLHAANKHSDRSSSFVVAPETQSARGFWYGKFKIGETDDLSLLIDTGSADVALDPGLYKPTSQSVNLHESGALKYSATQPNGCGLADIKYKTYTDDVCFAGLKATNQTFANVVKSAPPNPQTITEFKHNGLVGFSGTKASQTQLGGTPFFQQLCNQGVVSECRFGLAYGTNGRGEQILGGIDTSLFEGELSETGINTLDFAMVYYTSSGQRKEFKDLSLLLDSGTSNIVAPADHARKLFSDLGIQAVKLTSKDCKGVLVGYYACDSPAKVGFKIGSETFYIEPSACKLADNGNNNCTATITAVLGEKDEFPWWIVGQSWFQGKYVDFHQTKLKISVATLKDKTMAS